jgi:glutathione synthase/RimK-type ligase-like ATP-grasp enzyme
MILILTDKDDVHAEAVIAHLKRLQAPYVRLNQDVESLLQTKMTYDLHTWSVQAEAGAFTSLQITAVWLRKSYVQTTLERNGDTSPDFKLWKSEWNKTLQGLYSCLEAARWFTPFREVFRAENKYLQMKVAADCGFQLPATVISNNKTDLLAFAEQYQRVALKLMHQDVYRMEDGSFKGLYTNVLTPQDLASFKEEEENTVVLQQYVEKQYEVRYTVVGDKHFVARIDSQVSDISRTDWRRYDLKTTPYTEIEPPEAIRRQVEEFMRRAELNYGGLDFIVDETGQWVFLEINALGQYLWIEDLTGMPISEAIAHWLHHKPQ